MKVVAATGLVPVRALKQSAKNGSSEIFGVPPHKAFAGVRAGDVELVDIPASIETYDYPDPVEPAAPAPKQEALIPIPEGWEGEHHLKIIALAKKLVDRPDEKRLTQDEARAIVQAEVDRRKAAN